MYHNIYVYSFLRTERMKMWLAKKFLWLLQLMGKLEDAKAITQHL